MMTAAVVVNWNVEKAIVQTSESEETKCNRKESILIIAFLLLLLFLYEREREKKKALIMMMIVVIRSRTREKNSSRERGERRRSLDERYAIVVLVRNQTRFYSHLYRCTWVSQWIKWDNYRVVFCSWLFVPFVSSLSLIGSHHISERKVLQLLLSFSSLLSSIDSCHLDKKENPVKPLSICIP